MAPLHRSVSTCLSECSNVAFHTILFIAKSKGLRFLDICGSFREIAREECLKMFCWPVTAGYTSSLRSSSFKPKSRHTRSSSTIQILCGYCLCSVFGLSKIRALCSIDTGSNTRRDEHDYSYDRRTVLIHDKRLGLRLGWRARDYGDYRF